jgi:serine/threonine-protein kinase RsbW
LRKGGSGIQILVMTAISLPRQAESLKHSYPAVAASVPVARNLIVGYARVAGASAEQTEAVRLAASEAITNAVRHAYVDAQSGMVHIAASVAGDELSLSIADDGQGLKAGSHSPGLGIGLAVIASMADYFSVLKRPSGGTELKLRFALRTASARGSKHLAYHQRMPLVAARPAA